MLVHAELICGLLLASWKLVVHVSKDVYNLESNTDEEISFL